MRSLPHILISNEVQTSRALVTETRVFTQRKRSLSKFDKLGSGENEVSYHTIEKQDREALYHGSLRGRR
jgi:hypothetical protein